MLKFQSNIYKKSVMFWNISKSKYSVRCNSTLLGENTSQDKTDSYPPVADFYAGKSVFLTGGTGFLGKVLIEKLLYSCEDLDRIYMLIREKKNTNINDRMEEMFQNPLFTRIRNSKPEFLKKVIPVTGDITLPGLGIKPEVEEALIDKVSVVFHSAANVVLNEPLAVAMNVNFEGTQKILNLSKRLKKLQVFVHISTAYVHSNNQTLEETLYPPPAEVSEVYKFIEKHGHDKKETKKFIGELPNTYSLTKALTESYIAENNGGVPTIIIRPSIVGPIKEEPLKGWLDNWFGATMNVYSTAMGLNRVLLGEKSHTLDLIPADYVCNLTILAAARYKRSKVTEVLNCCTSSENPITLSDSWNFIIRASTASGQNAVPYRFIIFTKSTIALKILTIIFQKTPAHIADLFLRIRGREPKYVKLQSKVIGSRDLLQYFTARTWDMKSAKSRELSSTLSHEDQRQFPCDPTQIRWGEYMHDYCHGIYKYLMPKNTKH